MTDHRQEHPLSMKARLIVSSVVIVLAVPLVIWVNSIDGGDEPTFESRVIRPETAPTTSTTAPREPLTAEQRDVIRVLELAAEEICELNGYDDLAVTLGYDGKRDPRYLAWLFAEDVRNGDVAQPADVPIDDVVRAAELGCREGLGG